MSGSRLPPPQVMFAGGAGEDPDPADPPPAPLSDLSPFSFRLRRPRGPTKRVAGPDWPGWGPQLQLPDKRGIACMKGFLINTFKSYS